MDLLKQPRHVWHCTWQGIDISDQVTTSRSLRAAPRSYSLANLPWSAQGNTSTYRFDNARRRRRYKLVKSYRASRQAPSGTASWRPHPVSSRRRNAFAFSSLLDLAAISTSRCCSSAAGGNCADGQLSVARCWSTRSQRRALRFTGLSFVKTQCF
jgi:hypothetical protein